MPEGALLVTFARFQNRGGILSHAQKSSMHENSSDVRSGSIRTGADSYGGHLLPSAPAANFTPIVFPRGNSEYRVAGYE